MNAPSLTPDGDTGACGAPRRLSPAVWLYQPLSTAESSTSPRLVILSSWVDASLVVLRKYVAEYQKLYPTTAILLVRSSVRYCFRPQDGRRVVKPVPAAIRAILGRPGAAPMGETPNFTAPSGESSDTPGRRRCPELLVHMFSNGGSAMLYYISQEFAETGLQAADDGTCLGGDDVLLPPHVTIFDSGVSGFRYWCFVESILPSVPGGAWTRRTAAPLVHILCFFMLMRYRLMGVTDSSAMWARARNDRTKILEHARSYAYSEEDKVVDWRDVEEHAAEAAELGFVVVRREKFAGSHHVGHSRMDPERYWSLVKDTWDRGMGDRVEEKAKL